MTDQSLTIGQYTLSNNSNNEFWIVQKGGEGGEFNIKEFEEMIERFYHERF